MKFQISLVLLITVALGCSGQQAPTQNRLTEVVVFKETPMGLTSASCEAKNEVGGKCSIICPEGEKAHCQNVAGGGTPICECLKP
jgi:hypothetical protein